MPDHWKFTYAVRPYVRGTPGTRIEQTERRFALIEDTIRTVIPPAQIQSLIDNIGIPYSGLNLSLSEGALISSADGQIFIALKEGHSPTPDYVRKLRAALGRERPGRPVRHDCRPPGVLDDGRGRPCPWA